MINKTATRVILLALFLVLQSCAYQPVNRSEIPPSKLSALAETEQHFRDTEKLDAYFENAVAYAVLPTNIRAGTGFGGAWGQGWIIEQEQLSGKVSQWQFFAGINFGAQLYEQILFFRTKSALTAFKEGTFEFAGQANATAIIWGVAATPSFSQDIAMFTLINGGLLLEGSVGMHRYDFAPTF